YWSKSPGEWGVSEADKRESHNSLRAELKILIAILPDKDIAQKDDKLQTNIDLWNEHMKKLAKSERRLENMAIATISRKNEREFPRTSLRTESPQRGLQEFDSDSSCDEKSFEFTLQFATFDRGLGNYEEGTIIDPELALLETDEDPVPASERPINEAFGKDGN
ncbi:836_t:CDS:2, partial [Funneliformis geosporum]